MISRLLAILLFFVSMPAAAGYFDAGARYTFGPDNYDGISGFGEAGGGAYYLRGAYRTYKSEVSDRFSTYSLGAGVDRTYWSASAELSATPETGGYRNSGLYADCLWLPLGEPGEDAAVQDLYLGAFSSLTKHEDEYAASTTTVSGGRRSNSTVTRASAFKLSQTDYGLTASILAYGVRLSGRYTWTSYDQDLTALDRQVPVDIGGIGTTGFPARAASCRIKFPSLPLSPEAGYAKTWYKLDQPDSESVSAGLSRRLGAAELSADWENYNPGGGAPKSDYYSLGVTLSF